MNHYKHHLGDYAKDTAHLSMLEDGAYGRLMRRCYASEAALPNDLPEIFRIAGARSAAEKQAVKNVLKDFFELREDGYHQKRIDAEIAEYHAKAERNRSIGKTGGRPKTNPTHNPQETQTVSGTEPKQNPQETLAISHKPVASKTQTPIQRVSPGDSGTATERAPAARAAPPPEFPPMDDERVAALHALCLANGVQVRVLHAQQWVADGVSEVQMRAAIERGKQRKPGQSLNAGFLSLMLQDVRSEPAAYDAEAVAAEAIALIAKREAEREAERVAH